MSSVETRSALMAAAVRLSSSSGPRALTARGIATEAGVNQALVFYHFDGVEGLLRDAYEEATDRMVGEFATELEGASSFEELYAVGVRLSERGRTDGSASLLAQVIAAAHTDPAMAEALAAPLRRWHAAVADAVRRILAERGMDQGVDVEATSGALAAATIGMITLDAAPGAPLGQTLDAVRGLPGLVDRALRLVPAALARRILRGRE
jgi:AcrR family transcriptional regulator